MQVGVVDEVVVKATVVLVKSEENSITRTYTSSIMVVQLDWLGSRCFTREVDYVLQFVSVFFMEKSLCNHGGSAVLFEVEHIDVTAEDLDRDDVLLAKN
jgi:hypothetical protein